MSDFTFVTDTKTKKTVILAPKRAKRPDHEADNNRADLCPFCPGHERHEPSIYQIDVPREPNVEDREILHGANWLVRVIANKFPFTPHHEVVIHSPDHDRNFDLLPKKQVERILSVFQNRFNEHSNEGSVVLFHNRGVKAGESVAHPHSQVTVVPKHAKIEFALSPLTKRGKIEDPFFETEEFFLVCPLTSEWPDEVWIVPKQRDFTFGESAKKQLVNLSTVLQKTLQLMDIRHGNDFPFNLAISPDKSWYLRLVPRLKTVGGFEIGTGIYVNTQDPHETIKFISEHYDQSDLDKITPEHRAEYRRSV